MHDSLGLDRPSGLLGNLASTTFLDDYSVLALSGTFWSHFDDWSYDNVPHLPLFFIFKRFVNDKNPSIDYFDF